MIKLMKPEFVQVLKRNKLYIFVTGAVLAIIAGLFFTFFRPPEELKPITSATHEMVVAADPRAAKVGAEILKKGGSAVDAAIATQMVLNLVEPQSSGIGGGAFLLYYNAETEEVTAYDGRETAPMGVDEYLFITSGGVKMKFFDALVGGKSVGVPGLLRMLSLAHADHGKLNWEALFKPAIAMAKSGFEVSPRLHSMLERVSTVKTFPETANYFFDASGTAKTPGTLIQNPEFAKTLGIVANKGVDAFYESTIAEDVVETVKNAQLNPGELSIDDMRNYQSKRRDSVCIVYRKNRVCSMGPPSSGGITLLQILGILANFEMPPQGSVEAIHLIVEAMRLAYADRNAYIGDTDFVPVPIYGLLDSNYLKQRAMMIDLDQAGRKRQPGSPAGGKLFHTNFSDEDSEAPSTTHLSVVDNEGNAVSLTSSIEFAFGSTLMVRGFLLNNQLTDFSFTRGQDGKLVANRVQPGKRPRSSMAPTFLFDSEGELALALGSPGGSRIICYVATTLIGVIDWQLDPEAAVRLPHVCNRNGKTELESNTRLANLKPYFEELGHEIKLREMNSGLNLIAVAETSQGKRLFGAADPRREGAVFGR